MWTKLDDLWCETTALEDLSHADRWHYLCLIQFCSRTDKRDGVIRGIDARRVSDHPDPASALANLTEVGLLSIMDKDRYKLVAVDDHLPSDAVRNKTEGNKERQRRKRAHDSGDHSLCKADADCVTQTVTPHVTRDVGTGRDGTGRDTSTKPVTTNWNVTDPSTETGPTCEVCDQLLDTGSTMKICDRINEAHMEARKLRAVS